MLQVKQTCKILLHTLKKVGQFWHENSFKRNLVMKTLNPPVSACKYCKYYKPIGRRGGSCEMLGVSVRAAWKGCHLGTPQFAAEPESYETAQEDCNAIHSNSQKEAQEFSELQIKAFNTPDLVVS